jgi:hypothetical protein
MDDIITVIHWMDDIITVIHWMDGDGKDKKLAVPYWHEVPHPWYYPQRQPQKMTSVTY